MNNAPKMNITVKQIPGEVKRYVYGYTPASTNALTVDPNKRKGKNSIKKSNEILYPILFNILYNSKQDNPRITPYTKVLIQLYPVLSQIGEIKYLLINSKRDSDDITCLLDR